MILGIETSCDETAAALVSEDGRVLSSVVSSQAALHARFGGVVPEVASRRHLELVTPVVREALGDAGTSLDDVERVAVTQGPGLVGALLVGVSVAKAIAWARRLPLVPVNHLEGHVASLYLDVDPVEPPFLCLLASGGHTQLLAIPERGRSERLGTTLDDAAGEAFDKGSRLLGLGYPGGAEIDRLAQHGDPDAFAFPVARVGGLDFSFSGLKTALLYTTRELGEEETERRSADLAASYQRAIVSALAGRAREAAERTGLERIAVVGGVAANSGLRAALPHARVGGFDFSFSGLKTALLYATRELGEDETERRSADLAASYQRAVVNALAGRAREAAERTGLERIAVVGGVAANSGLRAALPDARFAPLEYCTDNAAMIASAARYVDPVPYPAYLELDAYASAA